MAKGAGVQEVEGGHPSFRTLWIILFTFSYILKTVRKQYWLSESFNDTQLVILAAANWPWHRDTRTLRWEIRPAGRRQCETDFHDCRQSERLQRRWCRCRSDSWSRSRSRCGAETARPRWTPPHSDPATTYHIRQLTTPCLEKNVTTLIVNNFYKLEPILIIFGTYNVLKLLASKRM